MSADQHAEWRRRSAVRPARAMSGPPPCKMLVVIGSTAVMNRPESLQPESLQWHSLLLARKGASLTKAYIGMGLTRNELMTPSVKRVGLRSPLFARRTIFLATDVAMGASRSTTFNRFKASSKAVVMAAVSSGPNAVLISRREISMSLSYGCESEELPGRQQGSAS